MNTDRTIKIVGKLTMSIKCVHIIALWFSAVVTLVFAEDFQNRPAMAELNEIVAQGIVCGNAVRERELAADRDQTFLPYCGVWQPYFASLQQELEGLATIYVDHVNGPLNEDETGVLYFTRETFRSAAGLNATGYRRSRDGITFEYGDAEPGDIIGTWLIGDIQKAFSALRWTTNPVISTGEWWSWTPHEIAATFVWSDPDQGYIGTFFETLPEATDFIWSHRGSGGAGYPIGCQKFELWHGSYSYHQPWGWRSYDAYIGSGMATQLKITELVFPTALLPLLTEKILYVKVIADGIFNSFDNAYVEGLNIISSPYYFPESPVSAAAWEQGWPNPGEEENMPAYQNLWVSSGSGSLPRV